MCRSRAIEDFVNVLMRQGPCAFSVFCDSLVETGQHHLLTLLTPDSSNLRYVGDLSR